MKKKKNNLSPLWLENKLLDFIKDHFHMLFFICITILSIMIRYSVREFISNDMRYFLLLWFDTIKTNGGLLALKNQVGDYNITYQTIIALMTYLPFKPLYMYKIVSIVFDYILALGLAVLVKDLSKTRSFGIFLFTYGIVLFFPTVLLNSAVWGQADSIYTAFMVWSLVFFLRRHFITSSLFLGVALAFKLQTVFILPALFIFFLFHRNFSYIKYLFLTVAVWLLSMLPAIVFGRPWTQPLSIYVNQTDSFKAMYLNIASFWTLTMQGGQWGYDQFKLFAILLGFSIIGLFIYQLLRHVQGHFTKEEMLTVIVWTVWTVLLFLPGMHERYNFFMEIILLAQVILNPKKAIYLVPSNFVTLVTYFKFLSRGADHSMLTLSMITITVYCAYTYFEVYEKLLKESKNSLKN